MMIEIKKSAENTVVEIVGRLDTTTAPSLEKTLNEDMGETKNLILDFKGLECACKTVCNLVKLG